MFEAGRLRHTKRRGTTYKTAKGTSTRLHIDIQSTHYTCPASSQSRAAQANNSISYACEATGSIERSRDTMIHVHGIPNLGAAHHEAGGRST